MQTTRKRELRILNAPFLSLNGAYHHGSATLTTGERAPRSMTALMEYAFCDKIGFRTPTVEPPAVTCQDRREVAVEAQEHRVVAAMVNYRVTSCQTRWLPIHSFTLPQFFLRKRTNSPGICFIASLEMRQQVPDAIVPVAIGRFRGIVNVDIDRMSVENPLTSMIIPTDESPLSQRFGVVGRP